MKSKVFGYLGLLIAPFFLTPNLLAQVDSMDVTFFYKPSGNPAVVFLPGEFNMWGPNSNGVIAPNAPSRMNFDAANGQWVKTVRLRVGGQPNGGVAGAYQYKINENGTNTGWRSDPLNPRRNSRDNDNSYLYVRNPTIHYLLPNSLSAIVKTRRPIIEAYLFPATRTRIDTAAIVVKIDNVEYSRIGAGYNETTKKFTFIPSTPLTNGSHQLILISRTLAGTINSDTTRFNVQADAVQILTQAAETWKTSWPIRGEILKANGTPDSTLRSATLLRDTASFPVTLRNGRFDTTMSLLEGDNLFSAQAQVGGVLQISGIVQIKRKVNHHPNAVIAFDTTATQIKLRASRSTDPDGQMMTFSWQEDLTNPQLLGVSNAADSVLTVAKPKAPGEYYFTLIARDPNGNLDRTRQFFSVTANGQLIPGTIKTNPAWVKQARVYEIFVDAFTPQGTLRAAAAKLNYIKAMGFNVIWLMPIFDNNFRIDGVGAGYDIVDFYNVAPEFGTNSDFRDFIDRAHQLGIRVVLDVTPNHTSQAHPFAASIRQYREHSPYWNYYQHDLVSNGNYRPNLPERRSNNGLFIYYDGFSEEIINYNWADLDARLYMIDVYKFWINEMGTDGFRYDVYWGPARRANSGNGGENEMGIPVREALKHTRPDLWLLAEDSGVGFGTERIYADGGGGVDSGYDWPLYFDGFRAGAALTGNVNNMHNKIFNNNFYPGPNSYFFRFLENHDETRLVRLASSVQQTIPFAVTLFTIPGIPLVYAGQEVGFGNGLDDFTGKRGKVDFDDPDKAIVQKLYQKLCYIREKFPAFWSQRLTRLNQIDNSVYTFSRPFVNENAVVAVNLTNSARNVTLTLNASTVEFSGGVKPNMNLVVSELLTGTTNTLVTDAGGVAQLNVALLAYSAAVYMVATEPKSVSVPDIPTGVAESHNATLPQSFALHQNFPNPFWSGATSPAFGGGNPETTIRFELPRSSEVKLRVFNLLGAEVLTLLNERMPAGTHTFNWDGKNANQQQVGSGVYLLRLEADNEVMVRKMVVVR